MKLRYLGVLLTFFLFVQLSSEQGFGLSPNPDPSINGDTPPTNDHNAPTVTTGESGSGGLVGVLSTIARNTTSSLLLRLEAPRDRVLDYIRPAVRSGFSRNVTNFLNSIWSRVQASNLSLIQNPLVRTSIVQPINTTLETLKKITAPEDAELTNSNLEIVTLERPDNEERLSEDYASSASEEVTAVPVLIALDDERIDQNDEVNDDQSTNAQLGNDQNALPAGEQQPAVDDAKPSEERAETSQPAQDEQLNPTKSRRAARFMDNYYVTPQRVRNLFDNVRQSGMQECLALAVCESHCRPYLYESPEYSGGHGGLFSRLINRVEQIPDLDHPDWNYYMTARRYGQQFFEGGSRGACAMCHARYYCPHEREYMLNRFASMGTFR